jgi:hypothetical protein
MWHQTDACARYASGHYAGRQAAGSNGGACAGAYRRSLRRRVALPSNRGQQIVTIVSTARGSRRPFSTVQIGGEIEVGPRSQLALGESSGTAAGAEDWVIPCDPNDRSSGSTVTGLVLTVHSTTPTGPSDLFAGSSATGI